MATFWQNHWKSIVWALIIILLSSIPGNQIPKIKLITIPHLDKLIHMFMYFVFTLLLISGNNALRRKRKLTAHAIIMAALISLPFGVLMEYLQQYIFTSRSAEVGDVAANIAGFLLATVTYRPINRITEGFI